MVYGDQCYSKCYVSVLAICRIEMIWVNLPQFVSPLDVILLPRLHPLPFFQFYLKSASDMGPYSKPYTVAMLYPKHFCSVMSPLVCISLILWCISWPYSTNSLFLMDCALSKLNVILCFKSLMFPLVSIFMWIKFELSTPSGINSNLCVWCFSLFPPLLPLLFRHNFLL